MIVPPTPLDPRRTAATADFAAISLKGIVEAKAFKNGTPYRVIAPSIALRKIPDAQAGWETEALFGEKINIYETRGIWAFGQLTKDSYVGWLPLSAIIMDGAASHPTHRLRALRSFVYPDAGMKKPHLAALSINAEVSVLETSGDYYKIADLNGYIYAPHLMPVHDLMPRNENISLDYVSIAEQFIHVPYLWGGKTSLGLDCSGLLQISMQAIGISAPRDSDMLENEVANALPLTQKQIDSYEFPSLQRGDLIFWKGHCGMMRDENTLLHSNGFHMKVVSEPFSEAVMRIKAKSYGSVTSIKRFISNT